MGREEFNRLLSPFLPPRLWLGSGVTITFGGVGTEFISSHLCPSTPSLCTDPLHWADQYTHLFYWFYVRTSNNGPPPPPSSSTNEERWIPVGSFALFLPLRSFLVAAI